MSRNRKRSHAWGIAAEYLCLAFLLFKGYTILARRHRNAMGEIDLVAARGGVIAFIEVKARRERDAALFSVTPVKQRRVFDAASAFLASQPGYAHHGLRFDAMVVTSPWRIHHLKDAWRIE